MLIHSRFSLYVLLLICTSAAFSQNESKVWYFGNNAGLDFNTNPPTILTNGMLSTSEGCASICNSAGSLLFYTDGTKIFDKTHTIMANGNFLSGSPSSSQSAIIVKKPGSNTIYYVFTVKDSGGALRYSEVDMTLAAGNGSVTAKNTFLALTVTEHLTSVRHCNGIDVWVLAHEYNSTVFHAYLVTSAGVNATPVTSATGASFPSFFIGCMKVSPNGRKLGFAVGGANLIEVHDFDPSTGTVSNPITLSGPSYPYGVEFSPDCTKLYVKGNAQLAQWDLTAGSQPLIAASISTFTTVSSIGSLQLAPNGKIYVARVAQTLGVVNNPDIGGAGCNYVDLGQSISPKSSAAGLPNFITTGFKAPPPPFTSTINCNSANFAVGNSTFFPGVTYSVTNVLWNFGDPSSGSANLSTLNNPAHAYPAAGTYTTTLILYYNCTSDTLRQSVTVGGTPTLSVAGNFTICENEQQTYTVTGASSYSWNTGALTSTLSIGPIASTTIYHVIGTATNGCSSNETFTVTVNKAPSLSFSGALITCVGEKRIYTASGASSYSWNTGSTGSSITVTTSSSFVYTVVGTGTNGCASQLALAVTVNKCTGISEADAAAPSPVHLYPNPVNSFLQIEATEKVLILLFDLEGRLVLKKELEPGLQQLDLSHLKNGVYSIRTVTAGESSTRRLVKLSE